MAGIYIHIPFCKQACHYCNFFFTTNLSNINAVLPAICHEIELQKNYLGNSTIETIYFGGGTPGILAIAQLESILQKIKNNFSINANAEITVEVNPDDMTEEKLQALFAIGVNRLSVGIQSFFAEDLHYMNRSHTAQQAENCILLAKKIGFTNISLDLIYGFPQLSNEKWEYNFQKAMQLGVNHLSCYAMTVEPKTALALFIQQKKDLPIDVNQAAEQFDLLMQWAEKNGMEHYEISNFAMPNHRAVHNSNYWKGEKYVGIGPSAHSFNGFSRQWNSANLHIYTTSISTNIIPFEIEILTPKQKANEYIMISLRTKEGIEKNKLWEIISVTEKNIFLQEIEKHKHFILENESYYCLNKQGKMYADKIASDLFV